MPTRRTGLLSALLLTAALLCAMPGLWQFVHSGDSNRMAESLRPPRMRTLTVWLLPGRMEDRRLISQACSAFEKEHEGVRVFLRRVTPDELTAADAVLPDMVLFETGELTDPQAMLLALAGLETQDASGVSTGQRYAVPLWLEPYVLSLPSEWLETELATPPPSALLAPSAPNAAVADVPAGVVDAAQLPWRWLLRPGALDWPEGVALQQCLFVCPQALRQQLLSAMNAQAAAAPALAASAADMPVSRSAGPTPAPAIGKTARVQTLAAHRAAVSGGEALAACVLTPAVSDRVRYAALCRDGEDARALLAFLMRRPTAEQGLISVHGEEKGGDALTQAALALYAQGMTLPNAFAHTAQELQGLCRDAFCRLEDPVQTLLGLR